VVAAGGASHEHVDDGVTGYVCSDTDGFVTALGRLLDDAGLRRLMGIASREHAMSYDLDRAMRATWTIYEHVMNERLVLPRAS
jgi:glycosyltransferase involved in cell wall biosynthesis